MTASDLVPLLINGQEISSLTSHHYSANTVVPGSIPEWTIQGTDQSHILAAVQSSARAFPAWAATPPMQKRELFLNLAQVGCFAPSIEASGGFDS